MNRLNEIEARANAATEGPWAPGRDQDGAPHMNGLLMVGNADAVIPEGEFWVEDVDINPVAHTYLPEDREFIAHSRTDVPDMAAALRAVLEVHQDGGESQGYLDDGHYGDIPHCCTECGSLGEYGVPWPCATVTAIHQHLGDDL